MEVGPACGPSGLATVAAVEHGQSESDWRRRSGGRISKRELHRWKLRDHECRLHQSWERHFGVNPDCYG